MPKVVIMKDDCYITFMYAEGHPCYELMKRYHPISVIDESLVIQYNEAREALYRAMEDIESAVSHSDRGRG